MTVPLPEPDPTKGDDMHGGYRWNPPPALTLDQAVRVQELRDAGVPYKLIAREIPGVSLKTLSCAARRIRPYGLRLRTNSAPRP